ncbi:MAG TPA: hypothetical protein VL285_08330 [Bryobacteraceae bacterium]|jgi:hypothetical protein|nr:hypothetical protein [Bryobacteraceae bacterium]
MRQALALLLLFTFPSAAAIREVETAWSDLGGLISSRKIALVLPDGARIEGKALSVKADAIVMTISKTSDRGAHPQGPASIPRASVAALRLLEMRVRGRIIATTAGIVGGLAAGAGIILANGLFTDTSTGRDVGAAVAIFGLPTAGYFIGRAADKKVTVIRIAP